MVKIKNWQKNVEQRLLKYKISTKILPEAYTWHFAGKWKHIKELKSQNLKKSPMRSEQLLNRAVSIPIFIRMTSQQILNIKKALYEALN